MRGCTKQFEANPFLTYILNHPSNFPPYPESGFLYGVRFFTGWKNLSPWMHKAIRSKFFSDSHTESSVKFSSKSGIRIFVRVPVIFVKGENLLALACTKQLEGNHTKSWSAKYSYWSGIRFIVRNPVITRVLVLTYPKRSIDMGGEEGGVCMDPAMVKEELAQWGLWWSPFNLSGGVSIPPPPSEI